MASLSETVVHKQQLKGACILQHRFAQEFQCKKFDEYCHEFDKKNFMVNSGPLSLWIALTVLLCWVAISLMKDCECGCASTLDFLKKTQVHFVKLSTTVKK